MNSSTVTRTRLPRYLRTRHICCSVRCCAPARSTTRSNSSLVCGPAALSAARAASFCGATPARSRGVAGAAGRLRVLREAGRRQRWKLRLVRLPRPRLELLGRVVASVGEVEVQLSVRTVAGHEVTPAVRHPAGVGRLLGWLHDRALGQPIEPALGPHSGAQHGAQAAPAEHGSTKQQTKKGSRGQTLLTLYSFKVL